VAQEYTTPLRYKSGQELAPVLERNRIDLEEFINYKTIRLEADGTVNLPLGSQVDSNDIWHAGNDGTGSTLDADTLDGDHLADIIAACTGNVLDIALYSAAGWTLTSGAFAQVWETTFATGLTAATLVFVDVTMVVQASNLTTGDNWGAQIEIQDALRGYPTFNGGFSPSTHVHGGSSDTYAGFYPSGVAAADGAHAHTMDTHGHDVSGTSGTGGIAHTHTAVADTSGGASAYSHTHSQPGTYVYGTSGVTSSHSHSYGSYANASTTTGSGGVTHTHSIPAHTTGNASTSHDHGAGSLAASSVVATMQNSSTHTHSVSGYLGGSHGHAITVNAAAGNPVLDTITLRWVGDVTTAADGTIKFACWGATGSVAALANSIHFNGQVWVIPATIAASLGELDDIPDVVLAGQADHDLLAYDTASATWKNMAAATAGLSPSSHSHTLDALSDVTASTPAGGDTIVWNAGTSAWEAAAPGVGALALDDLSDVVITAVADQSLLQYVSGSGWIDRSLAEAGVAAATHNHDASYISIIGAPEDDHFPYMTATGELDASGYTAADFAAAAHVGATGAAHGDATAVVAGFLTAADFTKLAGIEAAATADQTAAEILAALLTVDGTGSGLDADLLDGSSSAAFATSGHAHALDDISNVDAAAPGDGEVLTWDTGTSTWVAEAIPPGGTHSIGAHVDVDLTGLVDGDILIYNEATANFEPGVAAAGTHALDAGQTDVTIDTPADDEVLAYNSGTTTWINQTAAEAGLATSGHTHDYSGTYAPIAHVGAGGAAHADAGEGAGFMTAAMVTKLAGIETSATADQTAAEILTAIKTVDGAASGLDADLLDGNEAAAFAVAAHTHTEVFPFCTSGDLAVTTDTTAIRLRLPYAATLVSAYATCSTAPTGAAIIVDVHKDGTTIFTTQANRPTIAVSAFDSGTAKTPDVTTFAAGSYLTVNVDQIGSTIAGAGLTVCVVLTRSA